MSINTRFYNLLLSSVAGILLFSANIQAGVRINEFVASNDSTLSDQAGKAEDWIEIYNDGNASIDIGGYYLTDSKKDLTLWQFPTPTKINANGYLIVFADGTEGTPTSGSELHANFSLNKDGEYLALVAPDGETVLQEFSPQYPAQYNDISYGAEQFKLEFVNKASPMTFCFPSESGQESWKNGTGSVGFTSDVGSVGFTTYYYEMNSSISTLGDAENFIKNSRYWKDSSYPIIKQYDVINFTDTASSQGIFANSSLLGSNIDNFVLVAESSVFIPIKGMWTFGVNSDDGFGLSITGNGVSFSTEYTGGRSMSTTYGAFNFPESGIYKLRLIFFESGGDAGVELFAGRGSLSSASSCKLVGDVANGGLETRSTFGDAIVTNLSNSMCGKHSRVDLCYDFELSQEDVTLGNTSFLNLNMQYADGFVAFLNGHKVASKNAPSQLAWNSKATKSRTLSEIFVSEDFSVPTEYLVYGTNKLEITGLNNNADDTEFLINPTLSLVDSSITSYVYFSTPTPAAANAEGYQNKPEKVTFNQPCGYCTQPFTLNLSSGTQGAKIYYTTDGSVPDENTGTLYEKAISISKTTVLRATAFLDGHLPGDTATGTWIFVEDVLTQSSSTPTGWPASYAVNSHRMVYGMNRSVTGNALYTQMLRQGFEDIKTVSLVTDLENLFNAQSGIYVNPGNSGSAWERPTSFEFIDPKQGELFQIDAGLRIRGAASRTSDNPKHSFRLFFRGKYGESTLNYPLFGDEGAKEFKKIDFRTEQNHSWHREDPSTFTFVREVFARDLQRDAEVPYSRARYFHLFINGLYWGLYNTDERIDADYAASYLGGNSDDWDCIKTESSSGRATVAGDGNMDAYRALYDLSQTGFGTGKSANYYKARGLNTDGTRNPNYPVLLDEDNLIKFVINAYYMGDPDNPYSLFMYAPNNLFAVYNRVNPDGFKWFRHDAEHALGSSRGSWWGGLDMDLTTQGTGRTEYSQFEPIMLHLKLCENSEYLSHFADEVQAEFFNGGILSVEANQERIKKRRMEIDNAVVCESARWGSAAGSLRTRNVDWINELTWLTNTYIPKRTDIVLNQFKNRKWYPSNAIIPTAGTPSGILSKGDVVTLSSGSAFYYTTDGSDPRYTGGEINPNATYVVNSGGTEIVEPITFISKESSWKYYDKGGVPSIISSKTWKTLNYDDSTWNEGSGRLGFGSRVAVNTQTAATADDGTMVVTTYFRRAFEISDTNKVTNLKFLVNRDDGAVVYLNGIEVLRSNMPEGSISYSTYATENVATPNEDAYFEYTVSPTNLRNGKNMIAVEVHQNNASSTDLYFDLELSSTGGPNPHGSASTEITINDNTTVYMRSYNNGIWSPKVKYSYRVTEDYSTLKVSELMYAAPTEPDTEWSNDDLAWIEIYNSGDQDINMEGISFNEGITYTFPSYILPAKSYLVLCKNLEAFQSRYGGEEIFILSGYTGNFARKGETVTCVDPDDNVIFRFTYSNEWYPKTNRKGYTLEVTSFNLPQEVLSNIDGWRTSALEFGTPGYAPSVFPGAGDIVVLPGEDVLLQTPEIEGAINHQWYHFDGTDWQIIPGATGRELHLEKITAKDSGLYRLGFDLAENSFSTAESEIFVYLSGPEDQTLDEGASGELVINIASESSYRMQWQKSDNGETWKNITDATGRIYSIAAAGNNDLGFYRVVISDVNSTEEKWTSPVAQLKINGETIPPYLVSVSQIGQTQIRLFYSEPVTVETALNINNYQINDLTILKIKKADIDTTAKGVQIVDIQTSTLQYSYYYTIVVNNVRDISVNANKIADNSTILLQTEIKKGLLREVWKNYPGSGSVADLINMENYPDNPDIVEYVDYFEAPEEYGNYYGQKLSGYLIPPVTGNYVFEISSDDSSNLYLSTDSSAESATRICYVEGWCNSGEWDKYSTQASEPIALKANKIYYIYALHAEADGGDHLTVRWTMPDGTSETPIDGKYLYPAGTVFAAPKFVQQPQNITVNEGESAIFTALTSSATTVTYTWLVNGKRQTETGNTLTLENVALSMDGAKIRCYADNLNGRSTSTVAILTVVKSEPPTLQFRMDEEGVLWIDFTGTLLSCDSLDTAGQSDWKVVAGSEESPYRVELIKGAQYFKSMK